MSQQSTQRLDGVERKALKCGLRGTSAAFVRGGRIFEQARQASGLSQEQAADHYGVSPSLLTRQVTNQDKQHLSFQRIVEMPEKFQVEVITAWVDQINGLEVDRPLIIRRKTGT